VFNQQRKLSLFDDNLSGNDFLSNRYLLWLETI
jgi:hypothetical protein